MFQKQIFETLYGTLAFLTRNFVSANIISFNILVLSAVSQNHQDNM